MELRFWGWEPTGEKWTTDAAHNFNTISLPFVLFVTIFNTSIRMKNFPTSFLLSRAWPFKAHVQHEPLWSRVKQLDEIVPGKLGAGCCPVNLHLSWGYSSVDERSSTVRPQRSRPYDPDSPFTAEIASSLMHVQPGEGWVLDRSKVRGSGSTRLNVSVSMMYFCIHENCWFRQISNRTLVLVFFPLQRDGQWSIDSQHQ